MRLKFSHIPETSVEATVSSRGQVTLPRALRSDVGVDTGTHIRFSLHTDGRFEAEPVLYDLEDLSKFSDDGPRSPGTKGKAVLTFEETNKAKERRKWRWLWPTPTSGRGPS